MHNYIEYLIQFVHFIITHKMTIFRTLISLDINHLVKSNGMQNWPITFGFVFLQELINIVIKILGLWQRLEQFTHQKSSNGGFLVGILDINIYDMAWLNAENIKIKSFWLQKLSHINQGSRTLLMVWISIFPKWILLNGILQILDLKPKNSSLKSTTN